MSSLFSLFYSHRASWNSFAWRRICPWICVAVISVLILKLQTGTSSRRLQVPAAYRDVFMLCYSEAHDCLCSTPCQLYCALSQLYYQHHALYPQPRCNPESEGCKVQSSCYNQTFNPDIKTLIITLYPLCLMAVDLSILMKLEDTNQYGVSPLNRCPHYIRPPRLSCNRSQPLNHLPHPLNWVMITGRRRYFKSSFVALDTTHKVPPRSIILETMQSFLSGYLKTWQLTMTQSRRLKNTAVERTTVCVFMLGELSL